MSYCVSEYILLNQSEPSFAQIFSWYTSLYYSCSSKPVILSYCWNRGLTRKKTPTTKKIIYRGHYLHSQQQCCGIKGRETIKDGLKCSEDWIFKRKDVLFEYYDILNLMVAKQNYSQSKTCNKNCKERRLIGLNWENRKINRSSENLNRTPPTSITGNLPCNQK